MRIAVTALVAAALSAAAPAQPAQLVDTPVLGQSVERGALLSAVDFATAPLPASQARDALSPAEASGMEAARRLSAGMPVRRVDLIKPQLVRRGEAVTIAVRSGGLSIVTEGRALSGGALGDRVRVVNTSTRRTLDATVDGSGKVRLSAQ